MVEGGLNVLKFHLTVDLSGNPSLLIVHRIQSQLSLNGIVDSYRYEVPPENLSKKFQHAWRTWEMDLPVDAEGWLEIVCRCWDNALNTQPTFVRTSWNWGLHVHSISLKV